MRTHSPTRDLIFSARARGRPPNVQPFQRGTVNSASLELGTSEASLQKCSARPAFSITAQLLFPSRLDTGTSKYRPPPSSSRRLRPFVFAPLPLHPLRHCCLPLALISEPIPKFQNAPAPEIVSFMPCLLKTRLCIFCFCVVQLISFFKGCLMR